MCEALSPTVIVTNQVDELVADIEQHSVRGNQAGHAVADDDQVVGCYSGAPEDAATSRDPAQGAGAIGILSPDDPPELW